VPRRSQAGCSARSCYWCPSMSARCTGAAAVSTSAASASSSFHCLLFARSILLRCVSALSAIGDRQFRPDALVLRLCRLQPQAHRVRFTVCCVPCLFCSVCLLCLVPVNVGQMHWCCGCVDFSRKRIEFVSPCIVLSLLSALSLSSACNWCCGCVDFSHERIESVSLSTALFSSICSVCCWCLSMSARCTGAATGSNRKRIELFFFFECLSQSVPLCSSLPSCFSLSPSLSLPCSHFLVVQVL
jgi:hypothetical protein